MITKITFWCQKVLPVEFDDSLSYYETLCKVVEKLNEVVDNTNKAFNQLETDVNAELNKKQDTLVSGENIKTINGESVLGSGNIDIKGGGTEVEGNPTGDATDGDLSKIKIGSKIYNIHDYTSAIDGKLDKITSPTSYAQAYIKAVGGNQAVMNISTDAIAGSLITRDDKGRASISTPTENLHIANKFYVDDAVSGKQDTLVSGTNIKTINGNSVLGSGNINITTGTVVEGNPTADATDGDLSKIKIGSKIYNIHDYTSAINGKLNKDTRISNYDQVYGKQTTGKQSMINISNSIASNSLIIRDSNSRAYIAIPIEDNHIANKYYVDDAIKKNTNHLYMHTIYNSQYGTRASDFVFTFYSIRNTKYTTTGELYNAETNLHDKWIVASGYVYSEGQKYNTVAASITTAGILYADASNNETPYSGSIQDDVVQIF